MGPEIVCAPLEKSGTRPISRFGKKTERKRGDVAEYFFASKRKHRIWRRKEMAFLACRSCVERVISRIFRDREIGKKSKTKGTKEWKHWQFSPQISETTTINVLSPAARNFPASRFPAIHFPERKRPRFPLSVRRPNKKPSMPRKTKDKEINNNLDSWKTRTEKSETSERRLLSAMSLRHRMAASENKNK